MKINQQKEISQLIAQQETKDQILSQSNMQLADKNKQIADKNLLIAEKEHEMSKLKNASQLDKLADSAFEKGKSIDEKKVSDLKEEIKVH